MDYTAPICSNARIMIADNPAPVITHSQLPQKPGGFILESGLSTIIMEIVAQTINRLDRIFAGKPGQLFKRRPAIIRREELPAHGIARSLFEVQVGNEQSPARRPKERRLTRRLEIMSAKGNMGRHSGRYGQCATG